MADPVFTNPVEPVPPAPEVPPFPTLADRKTNTYNSKSYAWALYLAGEFVARLLALITSAKANADAAHERAVLAATSATTATQQADLAMGYRNTANNAATTATQQAGISAGAASTATTKRDEAVAARDQAVPAAGTAVGARDAAQGYRDQAQVFATQQIKASSTTSLTPGAGNRTFAIEANRSFVAGMYLVATSAGVPGTRMSGYVVSYDMATGQLVLAVDSFAGPSARADWQIGVAAPGGGAGAGLLTVQRITANTAGVANVHYVIGAAGIRLTIPSGMATDDRIAVSEDITPGLGYEIDFGTVPLRGFQNGLTQVISNRAEIALRFIGGPTGLI